MGALASTSKEREKGEASGGQRFAVGSARVVLASTQSDIASVAHYMHANVQMLGFDCEWPVRMHSGGGPGRVALLQLCGFPEDTGNTPVIALLHLPSIGYSIPPELESLLADPYLLKGGLNATGDASKIAKDLRISCNGIIELDRLAKSVGLSPPNGKRWSLAHLSSKLLGIHMDGKLESENTASVSASHAQMSRWDQWPLSSTQIAYSAQDAEISYRLLHTLSEHLASQQGHSLVWDFRISRHPHTERDQSSDRARKGMTVSSPPEQSRRNPQTPGTLTATKREAMEMHLHRKLSFDEIAAEKHVKTSTVASYVADAIIAGHNYNVELLDLPSKTLEATAYARKRLRTAAGTEPRLRDIMKALQAGGHPDISYDTLRLSIAHLRRRELDTSQGC